MVDRQTTKQVGIPVQTGVKLRGAARAWLSSRQERKESLRWCYQRTGAVCRCGKHTPAQR